MAYFRNIPKLQELLDLFVRDENWLIMINADPDAMASAMALRRIMRRKVKDVVIAKVNEITRPDNLAMVKYTQLSMEMITPDLTSHFKRFAMVDSQPHHHALFANIPFSVIIDHHPLPEVPFSAPYSEIRPEYGATCTIMTEYLYNMSLQPGKLLATALQFGIKTDTGNFERHFYDVDLRAYQYLSRFANHSLLTRISRSEFHLRWLEYFARACTNIYEIGSGKFSHIGTVDNPDILVNIADFFMRVYGIRWVAVSGICNNIMIVIFRSDGISQDVGTFAFQQFSDIGSAGGHKTMARAEIPLSATNGQDPEIFIWQYLKKKSKRLKTPPVTIENEVQCDKEDILEKDIDVDLL